MIKKVLLFLSIAILLVGTSYARNLNDAKNSYEKEIKKQSSINSANQKWQSKKAQNEEKSMDLTAQKVWLENRIVQYEKYIGTLKDNIAELKRKKLELARVSEELEPFLNETADRIAEFIDNDMPFLKNERRQRLEFLRSSLADYRISAGEKLRRILEALQIEAEYGKNIESSVVEIELNGERVTADVVRFGRLGFYYMSPDKKNFGYYAAGSWRKLPEKYKSELIKAVEIADRKRVMDVIYLPVSASEVR